MIGSATETNQTVNATSIKSNTSSNIGTTSNGKVTAGSRGQSTGGRRVVYSISGGTTSLGSFSLSGSVYQEANDDLGQSVSNVVSISKTSPSGNVSNSGGSAVFAVSATYSGTHDYTAGSYPINGNTTASIAATSGYSSLSPTSITGSGSVTLKLGANYSAAKTYTVTATAGSVSKSASVTQDGVVLSIVPEQTSIPADSAATTVYVICTSTLNGSANKPTVTSNQSWATVGTISSSGTTYTIPVSLTSNTSTTVDRIATITLYAASGTVSVTKTVTITQSKYVPAKPSKLVKFNGYFSFGQSSSGVNYSVVNIQPLESGFAKATFSAIEDSSYIYTGGTFNYYFVVSSSKTISGKITQTSTYSITVSKGSSTAISPVSITGASSAANYVLIYVNGSLFETHMIEQPEAQ